MSGKSDDGGPAFPVLDQQHTGGLDGYYGMSLRDYFAAHAPLSFADAVMAADLESSAPSVDVAVCRAIHDPKKRAFAMAMLVTLRTEYADAMMKARKA